MEDQINVQVDHGQLIVADAPHMLRHLNIAEQLFLNTADENDDQVFCVNNVYLFLTF